MIAQFVHLADVHLGNMQYGSAERFEDFGRAFREAVGYAVEHQVDFVIIAGDLFHKSAIDPATLLQAVAGLQALRAARIPVIAVEGNHERARHREGRSWLDFLANQGYVYLLTPQPRDGALALVPWDGTAGSYVDIRGVRLYGVKYLGAAMARALADIGDQLPTIDCVGVEYTICTLHAGLEGEVPHAGGTLHPSQIALLREHVDYLALGHIHKPYEREGWIYNPGSLETCDISEWKWGGGFYHVTIDTEQHPKHQARLIRNARRPFHRFACAVDGASGPTELYDRVRDFLEQQAASLDDTHRPVVELTLHGVLDFNRSDLDTAHIQWLIEETLQPLIARIKNDTTPAGSEIIPDTETSRPELERRVLRDLVERDVRYRPASASWAELIVEVKDMVLAKSAPVAIVSHIQERMRQLVGDTSDR